MVGFEALLVYSLFRCGEPDVGGVMTRFRMLFVSQQLGRLSVRTDLRKTTQVPTR